MFTLLGPQFVRDLHQRGFEVFLDLKFHDIPQYHGPRGGGGGRTRRMDGECPCLRRRARMMTAAREALLPFGKEAPLLIAVTVLTSMEASDLQDLGITLSPADYAAKLAALTQRCGLDGVVCSAQEAVRFKQEMGQAFKLVTPGIRPQGERGRGSAADYDSSRPRRRGWIIWLLVARSLQSADPAATLRAINVSLSKEA